MQLRDTSTARGTSGDLMEALAALQEHGSCTSDELLWTVHGLGWWKPHLGVCRGHRLGVDFILWTSFIDFILSVTLFYRSKRETAHEWDEDYTIKSIHIPPQLGFLVPLIP